MVDATFIDELASAAPTPGGGGACACAGALACALASMVGNLTVGKKSYAHVEDGVRASLACLDALRARMLSLVDEDARAFEPLAAAYRLPKATPDEAAAKNDAVDEVAYLAECGSRLARSDAGAAAALARAASDGASLNVYVNCASMDDAARAARYRGEADALAARTRERCDEVFDAVKAAIS